jgi:hypothetical protein
MKKFIITEEEKSRILGMHQSATSRQYLKESFKGPDGVVYKLDFKDVDSFNKFTAQSSAGVPFPYAKQLGFTSSNLGVSSFIINIWTSLAFVGKNPQNFSWGNVKMVQSLLSEASVGLKSHFGFNDAQQFLTEDKLKIWNQPANPKTTQYTIWNSFYDTYIKPDIQSRAALITTPATPTKP